MKEYTLTFQQYCMSRLGNDALNCAHARFKPDPRTDYQILCDAYDAYSALALQQPDAVDAR